MNISRAAIMDRLTKWSKAWDDHDLDAVMELFHEDTVFVNWTGSKVSGKDNLAKAWKPWFDNHGGFLFEIEDIFIDEETQKILYQWELSWPSSEKGYEGKPEVRQGVDVMHLKDGLIINKLTFSKTTVNVDSVRVKLKAG